MTTAIDWAAIQEKWCQGRSAHSLAKEFGLTHPAILKRQKREGWERADSKLPVPSNGGNGALVLGDWSQGNQREILSHVLKGVPIPLAAETVGIGEDELKSWVLEDRMFEEHLRATEARAMAEKIGRIDKAGQRGEWKADSWFTSRHPKTRGEFGDAAAKAGSGVMIVMNWSRDDFDKPETIEISPNSPKRITQKK